MWLGSKVYRVPWHWYTHESQKRTCQRCDLKACFSGNCLCLMHKYQGCGLNMSSLWLTNKLAEWYAQLATLVWHWLGLTFWHCQCWNGQWLRHSLLWFAQHWVSTAAMAQRLQDGMHSCTEGVKLACNASKRLTVPVWISQSFRSIGRRPYNDALPSSSALMCFA